MSDEGNRSKRRKYSLEQDTIYYEVGPIMQTEYFTIKAKENPEENYEVPKIERVLEIVSLDGWKEEFPKLEESEIILELKTYLSEMTYLKSKIGGVFIDPFPLITQFLKQIYKKIYKNIHQRALPVEWVECYHLIQEELEMFVYTDTTVLQMHAHRCLFFEEDYKWLFRLIYDDGLKLTKPGQTYQDISFKFVCYEHLKVKKPAKDLKDISFNFY